jgi:hypothetical protein
VKNFAPMSAPCGRLKGHPAEGRYVPESLLKTQTVQ